MGPVVKQAVSVVGAQAATVGGVRGGVAARWLGVNGLGKGLGAVGGAGGGGVMDGGGRGVRPVVVIPPTGNSDTGAEKDERERLRPYANTSRGLKLVISRGLKLVILEARRKMSVLVQGLKLIHA